MENVYVMNGYKNRTDYLMQMAEEFDVPYDTVCMLASMLGQNEDFDGLICALEDMAY